MDLSLKDFAMLGIGIPIALFTALGANKIDRWISGRKRRIQQRSLKALNKRREKAIAAAGQYPNSTECGVVWVIRLLADSVTLLVATGVLALFVNFVPHNPPSLITLGVIGLGVAILWRAYSILNSVVRALDEMWDMNHLDEIEDAIRAASRSDAISPSGDRT